MKINIVLEGKIRRSWTSSWIQEYRKRLSGFTPLEIIEWGSAKGREERFFQSVKPTDRLVALDEHGRLFKDSRAFAEHMENIMTDCKTLYIFVGEAGGHSQTVLENVKERWSLSGLTMSYEAALIVLAEQLYRSMTIITAHPYHK